MAFNSLEYLLFLLLTFALFWGVGGIGTQAQRRLFRTLLLLAASYVFYMSWNATFIFLIVGSTVLDYFVGLGLEERKSPRTRRLLLGLSLAGNLGMLGLFKYFNFFSGAVHDGLTSLGVEATEVQVSLALPVGISFYTFQTLSYTIDIYRGRLKPTRNFLEFATFVAFFPQLVAGPIVRARQFLHQFERPRLLTGDDVSNAAYLIVRGMAKKILIADFLAANIIDRVWAEPENFSSGEVWIAVYAYTWQLYGDFSGYTDIARGSARLFGFELPENFRRPFNSTGPIDFWDKWHITLSTFVRDYIYFPLGGSKKGRGRSYFNLFVAFLIAGVWHGAGWTFVVFGLWHGVTVAINRMWRDWRGKEKPNARLRPFLVAGNLFLFVFHWPMFRSPNLDNMISMYEQMFAGNFTSLRVATWVWVALALITIVHMSPQWWSDEARRVWVSSPAWAQASALSLAAAGLLWVGGAQAAPFIYFQF